MPGEALVDHLTRMRRSFRSSAAIRAVVWTLAFGAPAAVLAVLHARLTNAPPGAALDRFARAWTALAIVAAGGWAFLRLRRGPPEARLASDLDRRHGFAGLMSAAASLIGRGGEGPALGGLVLARADEAVSGLPAPRVATEGLGVKRTAIFLLLGLLLALVPGGPGGALSGMGAGGEGLFEPEAGPESRPGAPESRPESRNDRQTPLDDIVGLTLRSDHQIYPLGGEIHMSIELKTLRPVASDVPLEVVLAVTDGLPSPDVGFGEGFRPVILRLDWSIPKEPGAILHQRFPMKESLMALGIYRPGLYTCEAYARPRDDTGAVSEGVGSNQVTFQVTENKEDLQTKMPQPQGQGRQPEKKTPDSRSEKKGNEGNKSKPKLGDPDRLAGAQRIASLVQPIINAGPTIEKEVSVFEREPGGPAPPLPVPRKPPDDQAARTFLRRAEAPMANPDLSAEERDVLRRYFDSIRSQKKL